MHGKIQFANKRCDRYKLAGQAWKSNRFADQNSDYARCGGEDGYSRTTGRARQSFWCITIVFVKDYQFQGCRRMNMPIESGLCNPQSSLFSWRLHKVSHSDINWHWGKLYKIRWRTKGGMQAGAPGHQHVAWWPATLVYFLRPARTKWLLQENPPFQKLFIEKTKRMCNNTYNILFILL